jgi:hypothetical protein
VVWALLRRDEGTTTPTKNQKENCRGSFRGPFLRSCSGPPRGSIREIERDQREAERGPRASKTDPRQAQGKSGQWRLREAPEMLKRGPVESKRGSQEPQDRVPTDPKRGIETARERERERESERKREIDPREPE